MVSSRPPHGSPNESKSVKCRSLLKVCNRRAFFARCKNGHKRNFVFVTTNCRSDSVHDIGMEISAIVDFLLI